MSAENVPQASDVRGEERLIPHPDIDITATRRFVHPTDVSALSSADRMHYENSMVLADIGRCILRNQYILMAQITKASRRPSRKELSRKRSRNSTTSEDEAKNNGDNDNGADGDDDNTSNEDDNDDDGDDEEEEEDNDDDENDENDGREEEEVDRHDVPDSVGDTTNGRKQN